MTVLGVFCYSELHVGAFFPH